MTTVTPERASFVRKEYREFVRQDESVLAAFPSARSIVIETNLNRANALGLADATLNAAKSHQLSFEVAFAGTMELSSLVGQCPTAIPNFPRLETSGRVMRIYYVRTDYEENETIVRVRG